MKIEHFTSPELLAPVAAQVHARALACALAVSAIFWVFAWYADTFRSMVAIWNSSETFAHGYLIAPISAWLIWQRRRHLGQLEIRPWWSALAALAAIGFAWFFAGLAGVGVVQHYTAVLMVACVVVAVLGTAMAKALAFPLFFLLFAVPFGEFLEPLLMEHTADFTVAALRLTGIPVFREGQYFTIPSGSWSVVEACSGLRYLIASVTVGVLYAYLTYRTPWRRAAFVAASMVVPIVANWLRAYMIVMIGHLSGMKYAVGVDHLIYGWIFFGVVMLLLFWVGSFWREDTVPGAPGAASAGGAVPGPRPALAPVAAAAVAAALLAAIWPVAAERLVSDREPLRRPDLRAPREEGGWAPVSRTALPAWISHFLGTRAYVDQAYARDGARAAIQIGYYRGQQPGSQMISVLNTLVPSEGSPWKRTYEGHRSVTAGALELPVIESRLVSAAGNLLVWHWYWVDGRHVTSPHLAKFLQAAAVLTGRGDDSAVVVLYAPYETRADAAQRTLHEFAGAMLPAISTSLENARRSKPVE